MSDKERLIVSNDVRQRIYQQVKRELLVTHPDLAGYWTMGHVQKVLNWQSVQGYLREPELTDAVIQDIIQQALSYAPSRLLKPAARRKSKKTQQRPASKELSSAYGVAYFIALQVKQDAVLGPKLTEIRQKIKSGTGSGEAPFPWLNNATLLHNEGSLASANNWLREQVQAFDEANLVIRLSTYHPNELQQHWSQWVQGEAEHLTEHGDDLPAYLRQLADAVEHWEHTPALVTEQLAGIPVTHSSLTPTGLQVLRLRNDLYRFNKRQNSLLWEIHQLIATLTQHSYWGESDALEFILTDRPPVPIGELRKRLELQKPLSMDKVGLLQLVYATTHGQKRFSWSQRLRLWDVLCQREPKLVKRFKSVNEANRFKDLRKECSRAEQTVRKMLQESEQLLKTREHT